MPERRHRIALVDPGRQRVLVVARADGFALPYRPGDWLSQSDALALVADPRAVAICPPWCDPDDWVTSVFVASDAPRPAGEEWMSVAELARLGLSVSSRERLLAAIDQWRTGRRADDRAEWFVRGWRADVDAWVDEVLDARGFVRDGRRWWPSFGASRPSCGTARRGSRRATSGSRRPATGSATSRS